MRKALISGCSGQDGSYLAELLLSKGYEVHGIVRHLALEQPETRLSRIKHLLSRLTLHSGNLDNYASVLKVVSKAEWDECYHLGAQSFVADSFEDPFATMRSNINGTHYMLEALRQCCKPTCRFYFAASSEMFGKVSLSPQNELTPFHPRSPYAISKVAGFHLTRHYREAYGMHASSGILFNHESPRRGGEFVTRKISLAVAAIKLGFQKELVLGNLMARRDWGYAPEYVAAMHLMLQQETPDDYVIATGETHTVMEFCEAAFGSVELDWTKFVKVDDRLKRPAEVDILCGDASKAREKLGWKPACHWRDLARLMVKADLDCLAGKLSQCDG